MEAVVDKGLVRSIGISNHSPEKIQRWYQDVRIPVSVNQVGAWLPPTLRDSADIFLTAGLGRTNAQAQCEVRRSCNVMLPDVFALACRIRFHML